MKIHLFTRSYPQAGFWMVLTLVAIGVGASRAQAEIVNASAELYVDVAATLYSNDAATIVDDPAAQIDDTLTVSLNLTANAQYAPGQMYANALGSAGAPTLEGNGETRIGAFTSAQIALTGGGNSLATFRIGDALSVATLTYDFTVTEATTGRLFINTFNLGSFASLTGPSGFTTVSLTDGQSVSLTDLAFPTGTYNIYLTSATNGAVTYGSFTTLQKNPSASATIYLAPVPEPSSAAAAILSLLMLALRRTRGPAISVT